MDALNMKICNIDKFDIIECYTATRFTVGQLRLLLSSLSTTEFRYRALVALVEYMPTVKEQDAVHIVNAISECESQCEIRMKTLSLLVKCKKLEDNGDIGNVYKVITRKSLPENICMILQLTGQKNSTEETDYISETMDEIVPSYLTNARSSLTTMQKDFLCPDRKFGTCNKIHPMYTTDTMEIEDCPSSSSNITPKCCIF